MFPAKFWFCTDTTGSTGWTGPAPRLQIGDVFEIHIFTENLVICCYQVTKISALSTAPPMRLLHGALVTLVL